MGRIGMSQRGTATSGSVGAGEEQRVEGGGCGEPGGGELPAGEAVVEAVSGGRGQRAEASQCGACERASQAGEISPAGDEAGAGEVWGKARESGLGRRWRPNIWRAKTGCGSTRRRCGDGCWRKGCGGGDASGNRIGSGESGGVILGSWCRWTEVFTPGWRGEARAAA